MKKENHKQKRKLKMYNDFENIYEKMIELTPEEFVEKVEQLAFKFLEEYTQII